jgi:hypothetical protein
MFLGHIERGTGNGANLPDMCVHILDCSEIFIFSGNLKGPFLGNVGGVRGEG